MINAGKFSCRRLSASLPALASCVNAPTCTKSAPPVSGDFRTIVSAAEASGVEGMAVLADSGDACVGAPSVLDFLADTLAAGVVAGATACAPLSPNVL